MINAKAGFEKFPLILEQIKNEFDFHDLIHDS